MLRSPTRHIFTHKHKLPSNRQTPPNSQIPIQTKLTRAKKLIYLPGDETINSIRSPKGGRQPSIRA